MLPCRSPGLLRLCTIAVDLRCATAALLFVCFAGSTAALAAQYDSSIPEPRLLPLGGADPAAPVPVWHSRYAAQPGDQTRQAVPLQYRYQQARRPAGTAVIRPTAYQAGPYRSPQPAMIQANEPTCAGVAVWADEPMGASPPPLAEGSCPCQVCGGGNCGGNGCGYANCGGCGCADCGDCGDEGCCPDCDCNGESDLIEFELPFAGRLWARGDYLLWWIRDASLPPLVTTSSSTDRTVAGRLDQATTTILVGNGVGLSSDARSGARIDLGYWLLPCQSLGFEVTYLDLGSQSSQFQASSGSFATLARPFYNLETANEGPDAVLVAFPNFAAGTISVVSTDKFQTLEGLLRRRVVQECGRTIDLVGGYRYAYLQDGLLIDETSISIARDTPLPFGTTFVTTDQFDTQNRFNGGEIGVIFQQRCHRWSLELLMKLALGSTQAHVAINGSTAITPRGGGTTTYTGGILALPTNIGTYDETKFSLMPELGATLGFDITRHLRATLGYSFLYWSNVARPGDQINTDINASQFPPGVLAGAARPNFVFHSTDFWAQGLNVGLEYRF